MTGLLARMAARATGATPGIWPRLPARFEAPTGPEGSEAVVASRPAHDAGAAYPVPRTAPRDDDRSPETRVPRMSRAAGSSEPPPGTQGVPVTSPAEEPELARAPSGDGPAGRPGMPRSREAAVASYGPAVSAQPRTTAPLVAATPDAAVVAAPAASRPSGREGAAQGRSGAPDVVHVTIGRVEVRATVAAPSPAPPAASTVRAQSPAAEPVSLHDYLTGKRGTP
jgi:hypothetical protein